MAPRWLVQLRIGIWKNFTVGLRHWPVWVGEALFAIIAALVVVLLEAYQEGLMSPTHPDAIAQTSLVRCLDGSDETCTAVAYAPNDAFTTSVVELVATRATPSLDTADLSDITAFASSDDLEAAVESGTTRPIAAFTLGTDAGCDGLNLTVFHTASENDVSSIALGSAVLAALAELCGPEWAGKPDIDAPLVSLLFATKSFPVASATGIASVQFPALCSVMLFLAIELPAVIMSVRIFLEKERGLKRMYCASGMREGAEMFAWIIWATTEAAVAAVLFEVVGYCAGLPFFWNSGPLPLFLIFLFFSLANNAAHYALTTFFSTVLVGGAAVFLVCAVAGLLLLLAASTCLYLPNLLRDSTYRWVPVCLQFFPPYVLMILVALVAQFAFASVDPSTGASIAARGFGWTELFAEWNEHFTRGTAQITPAEMVLILIGLVVFYCVVGWYVALVSGKGRGARAGILFFMKGDFWRSGRKSLAFRGVIPEALARQEIDGALRRCCRCGRKAAAPDFRDTRPVEPPDEQVIEEAQLISDTVWPGAPSSFVTLAGLGRTFFARGRRVCRAVEGLWMDVPTRSCFVLLGGGGVGKSTVVNMLAGVIGVTRGTAFVDRLDLVSNAENTRSRQGVCFQGRPLPPELTPVEFFAMMSGVRGVSACARSEAEQELTALGVRDAATRRIADLGSNERALLAIGAAFVQNPPIVYLDEPTSGLDALERRRVWTFIRARRRKTTVFVASCDPEEAAEIADKTAVLEAGAVTQIVRDAARGYILTFVAPVPPLDTLGLHELPHTVDASGRVELTLTCDELRTSLEALHAAGVTDAAWAVVPAPLFAAGAHSAE